MPGLRKNTFGKNKFFGYQKERIIKCQRVSWPKDDVIFLIPFFIHLCEAPDFDKGQDCWPPCDSVFIPMCNKRYISKPKLDQFPERLIPSCRSFLFPVFLAEFPSGAWVLAMSTYLPLLLSSTREGAQGGAPSDIQVAPVAQRRWCKFLVLEFYWYSPGIQTPLESLWPKP